MTSDSGDHTVCCLKEKSCCFRRRPRHRYYLSALEMQRAFSRIRQTKTRGFASRSVTSIFLLSVFVYVTWIISSAPDELIGNTVHDWINNNNNNNNENEVDCLHPRSMDIEAYLKQNGLLTLPQPWIHIGLPKTGTTTLEHFWKCGLNQQPHDDLVSHSTCKVTSEILRNQSFQGNGMPSDPHKSCPSNKIKPCELCGTCMKQAKNLSLPLMESCGNYTAWAQMDTEESCYFPQLSALDMIHQEVPNATFIFMFRDVQKWIQSVQHYKKGFMMRRLRRCHFPYWQGRYYLKEWFCSVVNHARRFVAEHPTHAYLEINVDDPASSRLASQAFGISESCWGVHNVNQRIHGGNITTTGGTSVL